MHINIDKSVYKTIIFKVVESQYCKFGTPMHYYKDCAQN